MATLKDPAGPSRVADERDWLAGLSIARTAASHSHDRHTKNGAVLLYPDGRPLMASAARNQLPNGLAWLPERHDRPLKYLYLEHAERNAIYQATRFGFATDGLTMCCLWAACVPCARAIIKAGIVRLVREKPTRMPNHWTDQITLADEMLVEARVTIVTLDRPRSHR